MCVVYNIKKIKKKKMKNNFYRCLTNFLSLLLVSITISCNYSNNNDTLVENLLVKAEKNSEKNPDSTLQITNKLLQLTSISTIDDEKQLQIYKIKYRALLNLGLIDSICITGQKIREVASRIPDSLAIAETLIVLYSDVDYKYIKTAKEYVPSAINTFKHKNNKYEEGVLTALNGVILRNEGDFSNSQKHFFKALEILEPTDSLKVIGRIYNSLGNNFASAKIMDKSTYYYNKALKIAEIRKDSLLQASVLANLGINYKISNPDLAIKCSNSALNLLPVNKAQGIHLKLKYNLANIFLEKKEYDKAELIFKKILDDATKTDYQEGIIMAKAALGNVYGLKKQFTFSVNYYTSALKMLKNTNQKDVILMLLPELIDVYKKAGDTGKALYYTDLLLELKSKILTVEKTKYILELEKKYQAEKKNLEIKNLQQLGSLRYNIIIILSISLLIVLLLWRQRNRLYRENKNAYAVLIKKYKEENENDVYKNDHSINNSISNIGKETFGVEAIDVSLYQKLVTYYKIEKPYLDCKLKAEFIAKEIGVPQRDIALILKANGFTSFSNFNNKFRVEEVKKCFEDTNYELIKMDVIAKQCGFGSKQPFYSAFEEFTGLNPGYYRSEIAKL